VFATESKWGWQFRTFTIFAARSSYLTDDQSPAAAPRDYAAWPVLLLPYLGQHSIYEMVDLRHPLSTNVARHAEFRTMPMPVYFCKSRRPPEGITRNGAGAVGDKATISRCDLGPGVVPDEPRTWDGAMLVCRAFNSSAETAEVDGVTLKPGEFRSVTNFASVIDGLSNTIFIADKAVHRDRMGGHPTDSARTIEASEQDGTYYYGGLGTPHRPGDLLAPGAIAYWSRRLAPDPRSGPVLARGRREDPRNRFGSSHPGILLALLGDGSMRAIHIAASDHVLQRDGCRNDRRILDLP